MRFESPWMLLFLAAIPLLLVWRFYQSRGGKRASIRFSWTGDAARAHRSIRQRVVWIPTVLRAAALILLVIALARPQKGLEEVRELTEGIAIEMVVDRSSSMGEEMRFQGRRMNRLEVVKEVFEDFVLGGGKLGGRESDLIGIISFAHYPETTCPLILGHRTLPELLKTINLAATREEDGTAIGDAIELAAARLHFAEKDLATQNSELEDSDYRIKSKIMILLTDGEQTRGTVLPEDAAKKAKEWGIKIYTIAVGSQGLMQRMLRGSGGAETLAEVAKITGGRAYRATDAAALTQIYEEIDELERTEIEALKTVKYKELFLPFALIVVALLVFEILLNATVFRKIP
ncbi:MAG: Ca-activated chloride channel family protein [Verrucomicrobiales bacterium]|jgi:Ca-activated chloride channel family protein